MLSSVDVDDGGRWESEGNIQVFLLFFRDFSGFGSMSNMARTEFDKVRRRNRSSARQFPIVSDHVRRRIRRRRWRRLRLRWPKVCVQCQIPVDACVAEMHFSFAEDTFVRNPYTLLRVHQIDPLREKRMTDTTSWLKTTKRASKPV